MTTSLNTGAEVRPLPRVVFSRVVLCGDPGSAEFEAARRESAAVIPAEGLSQVRNLAELREWLGQHEFPDLIVLVQTWSDEFHFAEMLSLPGIGPFSRLICCYGPWCISDGRSRLDFPLAVRVPLEDLRPALFREWEQLTAPHPDDSILPWTAGRDEIFGDRFVGWVSRPVRMITDGHGESSHETRIATECREIRVHSADRELSRLWRETLQRAGFPIAMAEHQHNGQVVLWDIDVWSDSIADAWRGLRERFPETQIVALTGFVVPDFIDRLHAAGAAKVLSKLLPLNVLVSQVRQLLGGPSCTEQGSAAT